MSRYVQQLSCRFHPEANLIEDYRAGDMICSECGLVVGDRMIDVGSEWRTFSSDTESKDMNRVGAAENPLLGADNLQTVMSAGKGAGALDEEGNQKYSNGPRQISAVDRAVRTGHNAIRQMATRIGLPNRVIIGALSLYKQCHESKCVRGRSQDCVVATCIYIACRQEGSQRTMKEICAISTSTSKKEIGRCFRQILKNLADSSRSESVDIKNLIPRFCNQLDLKEENHVQKTAVYITERAKEICDIDSRAPDSIAGASIYMACAAAGEGKAIKDIALVAGAVESTIRQIYKRMLPKAKELFPSDFQFKCPLDHLPLS